MEKNYYLPKQKVQLVLGISKYPEGLSTFCRRKSISEASFYKWQKQLVENADALFEKTSKSAEKNINRLEK
jgi:hypothetical protein